MRLLTQILRTLAAECVVTTCIIVMWVPTVIASHRVNSIPLDSSQFYFAWQVYALAQKPFLKYVVSGVVVVLSLLAFGESAAPGELLPTNRLPLISLL